MILGWGRSWWRAPGRIPKPSRSSASVIGATRAWCSCGPEAGTPRRAWRSSGKPGYRSSKPRTNLAAAIRAAPPAGGGGWGGVKAGTRSSAAGAAEASTPPRPSPIEGEGADAANAMAPQARIIGVSVQEMVGEGVEVIIGVSCDPQLGPGVLFGSGGVVVGIYNDVALSGCPITPSEGKAKMPGGKGAPWV